MQTIEHTQSHAHPDRPLLAGVALLAALAFAAPGHAFAACGGSGASTGTHAPTAGAGGTHSGSTPSAGSTGGSSCGVNTTSSALTGSTLTPSLAGVYSGAITGNGGKRNRHTTNTTTASVTPNVVNTPKFAGGAAHIGGGGHFFRAGKRP